MYSASGEISREELVERYAPLVKRIAYHLVARLPASVQVDDLIQAGMLGLLDAAGQYDPSQGASFETYAGIRIRGSMIDELRRNDWAPKSVHRKARDLDQAIAAVEARTGRDAEDAEVARELGVELDEYFQMLQETSSSRMLSLDDMSTEDGENGEARFASSDAPPQEAVLDEEFREHLIAAIDKLPEREQMIMSLYYEQEVNLREIGEVLGVSESRVSQLLSQAHGRLRARLQEFR